LNRGSSGFAAMRTEPSAVPAGSADTGAAGDTVPRAATGAGSVAPDVRAPRSGACASGFTLTVKASLAWSNPVVRTVLDSLPLPCWCVVQVEVQICRAALHGCG
jgi:hypothetical protein